MMAEQTITREDALIGVLRLEPETPERLRRIAGWPDTEFLEVVYRLMTQGRMRLVLRNHQTYYAVAGTPYRETP